MQQVEINFNNVFETPRYPKYCHVNMQAIKNSNMIFMSFLY